MSTFACMRALTEAEYIHSLIAEGEHQTQDFKFEISDSRKIAKTLSAFANTDGGRLLIGVKDNGKIAGTRSEEELYMIDAAARLYCYPEVLYVSQIYSVEKRQVMVVDIEACKDKPVYAKDDKGKLLAYLRIDDENILASPVHLRVWKQTRSRQGELMAYTERERYLLELLDQHKSLSLNQCCKAARLPRYTAERLLAKFIRFDVIEAVYKEQEFRFQLK